MECDYSLVDAKVRVIGPKGYLGGGKDKCKHYLTAWTAGTWAPTSAIPSAPSLLQPSTSVGPSLAVLSDAFQVGQSSLSNARIPGPLLQRPSDILIVPNFLAEGSIRITVVAAEVMRSFYNKQQALVPDASKSQQLRIVRRALQTVWQALGLHGSVSTITSVLSLAPGY